MHPVIRDLTFLHRKPLRLGMTAKERKAFAKPNRKLDDFEEAMKGVEPAVQSWFWPAVAVFAIGVLVGANLSN